MKQSILFGAIFILMVSCCAFPVSAREIQQKETVASTELIENAREYDNTVIEFKGEVIGDVLKRGSNVWVNISDADNSAIGVYMSADAAKKISVLGHYGTQGDIVLITGTFHMACADHGGDMDIHADQVQILSKGYVIESQIPEWLPYLAGGSILVAVCMCVFAFFRIKRYNINIPKKTQHEV
jgi:hypothetical protein